MKTTAQFTKMALAVALLGLGSYSSDLRAQAVGSVTHTAPTTYVAGSTFTVTSTFTYTGTLGSLLLRPHLPSGWVVTNVVSSSGGVGLVEGEIDWIDFTLPASPIQIVYTVYVPVGAAGAQQLSDEFEYLLQGIGMVNPASTNANPPTLTIHGAGDTQIINLLGNLAFGDVNYGTPAQRTFIISNSGNSVLSVANVSPPVGFMVDWTNGLILPGKSTNVHVFVDTGLNPNPYSGNISVTSDATSGNSSISVSANVIMRQLIVGYPMNLDFGNVGVGSVASKSLVLTNMGNVDLTISNIIYPAGFSGATSLVIVKDQTATLPISFAPSSPVSYGGVLTFVSDATSIQGQASVIGMGVWTPPSFTLQPTASTIVTQGLAQVQFHVMAAGSPPLGFQWRKNGANLSDVAGKVSGATSSNLTVLALQSQDEGTYTVVVSNALSQASLESAQAVLTVLVPPSILQPPTAQSTTQNGSVTNSVGAAGSSPFQYQWKKNGTALTDGANVIGSQSNVVILRNLTTNDNGATLTVTVSNGAGVTNSSPVTITVVLQPEPPAIVVQPQDQRVAVGGIAIFTVQNSGYPMPTYQWSSNGVALTNNSHLSGVSTATLVISNVADSDQSLYSVFLTNDLGSVTSSNAQLTVVHPPVIPQPPASQDVAQGQPFILSVANVQGTPPLAYQWLKDGAVLPGATSSIYEVMSAQTNNAGAYQVVVSNLAATVTSPTATIRVIVAPIITQAPQPQTNCAGGSVTFTVAATGTSPSFYWFFASPAGPVLVGNASSLTLANVQAPNAGIYQVVVSNLAGMPSASAQLTVNLPPVMTGQPQSQTVTPGSTATFTASAAGGGLSYQWSKNGTNVAGATGASLVLANITTNDVGNYSVRIVNGCGSTNSQLASLAVVNRALQIAGSNTVGGAAIALPVQLIGAGNETGVVFTIGFDPSVVSLTGVQPGTAASGTPTWSTVAAGQVRIAVFPTNAVFAAGVSELARVQFTVSSTVSNTMMPVVFVGTNAVTWDATGQGLVCSLEAGQVYVGGGMPVSATTNAATGFFDGTVTVVVPAGGIAAGQALRLLFYNLGVDAKGYPITIYNPSGAVTVAGLTNPVPYLQANGPLAAGPFSFTVHYMVVDRTTQPAPTFELQVVSVPFYQVTGSNVPVTMVYTTKRTVQLRFLTEVGKTNYIQYRSNLASNQIWNTVSPAIRGYGGGITNVWTDDGPPKTESSPSNAPIRFYRVLSNP